MSLFKSFVLTIQRPTQTASEGKYINGRWVPGSTSEPNSTFEIQTSVQPANEQDLEALPEGLRTEEIIKMFPSTSINTVDQHILQEADIIEYNSKKYSVIKVDAWQNNLINHYKVMANRIKE